MKNTTSRTPNEIARLDKLVTISSDAKTSLNITMVYEDDETREWAREAFERVLNLAGEQPLRPTWWRLSNLSQPGVLAAASSTAMRADVIVVAVRAAEGLPLPFYAWINAWSPNRLQLNGVLVALLGAPRSRTNVRAVLVISSATLPNRLGSIYCSKPAIAPPGPLNT